MALFHVEGQVEISQHGAVLRLAPQGARPPQQPAADVPITPKAPSTRPSMADISRQARDGVIVIHDTRLPLTRGPYHRLVNNVARSEGLPTGVSGLWNAAAHTRLLRVLSEPVRESRRKPVLALEDDDKISKDQAGNPPLAIQDIVGNNTKEDIVENNPVQNGTPTKAVPDIAETNPENNDTPPEDSSSSSYSSSESENTTPLPTCQEVLEWPSDWADTYISAAWLTKAAGENPKRRKLAEELMARIAQCKAQWEAA